MFLSRSTRFMGIGLALVLAVSACGGGNTSAPSAAKGAGGYGECTVPNEPARHHLQAAVPGQLTIKVPVPAGAAYKGNTIEQVKSGYLYCLSAQIAQRGGLPKLALVNVSYDALVSGTVTGFDIAPYDLFATDARKKVADFSDPYLTVDTGVMVKKGSKLTQETIKDAKIGVLVGSLQLEFINNTLKPTKQPSIFQSEPDAYAALRAGQIDAVLLDTTSTMPQTAKSNGAFETIAKYAVGGGLCILLPKGSPNKAVVNQILADMKSDGSLKEVFATWLNPTLGGDPAQLPTWTVG
ncbi:ABC transporter substrate-binding protein [Micromonospora sp. NPDC023633]|uniref:ABC transporter substrate-binding protein n=1 Tax=Micromonospora sp. NPDC023633 TaxID=3154320 RepID=UPI003407E0C4